MRGLLDEPERAEKIAMRGYEIARERFTWKEWVDKVLEELNNRLHAS